MVSPVTSYCSRYYAIVSAGDSSLFVADGNSKGGVGIRTTQLSSQEVDCSLDGGDCVSYRSGYHSSMIHYNKERSSS